MDDIEGGVVCPYCGRNADVRKSESEAYGDCPWCDSTFGVEFVEEINGVRVYRSRP